MSLKDVAARTGVSFQTVSKVLRGSAVNVSEATRTRVSRGSLPAAFQVAARARKC